MKFGIQGNDAMYIDSSKRVLIGTPTEGSSTSDDLTIATSGYTGMTLEVELLIMEVFTSQMRHQALANMQESLNMLMRLITF